MRLKPSLSRKPLTITTSYNFLNYSLYGLASEAYIHIAD